MIERPMYLDRLKRLRGTELAKVLTGMRRAGKSGILRLLKSHLLEEGVEPTSILSINLELIENQPLCDAQALCAYVREHATPHAITYVLIDEAQEVEDIGRVAYSLLEEGMFDLYVTGSHSKLITQGFRDIMSGRYVEIPVFPLSFAEYYAAHSLRAEHVSDAHLFQSYLTNGGLPHTLLLENDPFALRDYLDGVYHTVVRRDVTADLGHEDPVLLDSIVRELMRGLGKPSSANGISRDLASTGKTCTDDTAARYMGALSHAYTFHRMSRQDLRTGTLLKTQEKYYVTDLGLSTLLLGPFDGTRLQGLLENVVYFELRRRFGEVHTAKHYNRHICFMAQGVQGRAYFQVAPSVLDPHTLAQALAPLKAERDNYPKTLLTLDEIGAPSHNGIVQRNLVEWLLDV